MFSPMMMKTIKDLTILDKRKVRPKPKEELDLLEFTREELPMLKRQNILTIFQYINHSHWHIHMTM